MEVDLDNLIFDTRSLKLCMEVDLGNPFIDLTSTSTSEVKNLK